MNLERHVLWARVDRPGLEHLWLRQGPDGVQADGVAIGVKDGAAPFRLRYRIHCDERWIVETVRVEVLDDSGRLIELKVDGRGGWTDGTGAALPLDGCLDVDIFASPFTNTLPIRRLGLAPGRSAELLVAYVSVPDLALSTARQRYTCLERRPDGGRWRYESLTSGFTTELPVDADGLVLDYPGFFTRAK